MMIMKNANRLIDNFKKQAKYTIWKHMNNLADNDAVYSIHLNGLSPYLMEYDIYLYCNSTNMVVVCLDSCGHSEKQTYEESETFSPLILKNGCTPRVSIVYKLAKAVRLAKERLMKANPDINVYGVLLTEAEILNAFDLDDLWDQNNVMVIDGFTRLKYRFLRVNDDDELACKDYARTVFGTTLDLAKAEEPAPVAPEPTEAADESETTQAEEEEAKPLDEQPEAEVQHSEAPTEEEELFPDGEIVQNQNTTVKVEILRPIANPREELDKLVGCADIKQRMDELVALTIYNKMMRERFPDSRQHEVSLHSVFLGRPGTGKTTVCKIYGSLLRQAGALSKGHIVVCDRSTFIGSLWGDEERAIKQAVDMANGGVLMIDEAYMLNGKNENDPGKIVVQMLMDVLADETRRDIAIVLCGYKEPMTKLLAMNPGLQSRFPNKFEFKDFTVDELLEITRRRVKAYDYQFTAPAWEKYSKMLTQAYQVRDPETWGNARFVGNQLERIYIQHATRCVRQQPKNKRDLLMLTPEDIVQIEIPRPRTRIGF